MTNRPDFRLFNTMTRAVELFTPRVKDAVGIYCCGPTVYNFQHIGNLRTYIFEDLLTRTLQTFGYKVHHVMNITDVGHLVGDGDLGEDKMMVAMRREGRSSYEIADYYTEAFFNDCAKLKIRRPGVVCKATDHIPEMIALIQRIIANGFAYQSGGNVYFDVMKLPDYGKLAKLDLTKLQAGARIDVDSNKRSPFDFVLWFTKSKFENQEMQWDSPWGRGYPGWHIECSAMSMRYLGEEFDIHCGGIDHIPNHHTNEIAQSEAALGKPWVRHWMHGEFLVLNAAKMSKSTGGFITLTDLINQGFDPIAYRLFCLSGHYRSQLNFSADAMQQAGASLSSLKRAVLKTREEAGNKAAQPRDEFLRDFYAAVANDLNMPQAIAVLWSVLGNKEIPANERLGAAISMDGILGLGIEDWREEATVDLPTEILTLVEARKTAREGKLWKESDRLRDEILAAGYVIEDAKDGMKVTKR
jgi:cysteinyl-tRNA synthetase